MRHDTVTPYESNEQNKKEQVNSMFDKIAPYYDFLNRLLSVGIDTIWRKKAIATLKKDNPGTILDIATGTADLAIEMSKQLNANEIIGMDLSQNMINIGNKKLDKRKLNDRIKLETGDSENLKYDSNKFDAVTAAFGVRNFANLEAGLSEMRRVLKNEGSLMILEFSKPTLFPFKQMFNFYFRYVLPLIGKLTSKDPKAYEYLYKSVQSFPDYEDFEKVLKNVGFRQVTWKKLSLGICTIYNAKK